MKKFTKLARLGKLLFKDKITNFWDKLLTEKPQGDLLTFYQKRLNHFWSLPDLEKIIGKEHAGCSYAAMAEVEALFEDKGLKPLPPPLGQKAFQKLLSEGTSSRPIVAYIHIPFCKIKCTYCSFFKQGSSAKAEAEYVTKLLAELEQMCNVRYLATTEIKAVFLGGGTPGTLTKEQLSSILQKVRQVLPLSADCEITVESSIYDMDAEKLTACIESGANRFSFGVQTFDTDLRRKLGRPDACEEVMRKLQLFAATGTKIIIDLIYGLPGQTKELLQRDLQLYLECGLSGVDLYKLQIFPGTPLGNQFQADQSNFPTGKALVELFISGAEFLNSNGCRQLSCCHWATDDRESSRYNTMVKNGAQVLAFGAGCGGSLGNYSYMQPFDMERYGSMVEQGAKPFVMLFERDAFAPIFASIKGQFDSGIFEPQKLNRLVDIPFQLLLQPLLERWRRNGLIEKEGGGIYRLTTTGLFWQNQLNRAVMIAVQYLLYGPRIAGRKSALTATSTMENRT